MITEKQLMAIIFDPEIKKLVELRDKETDPIKRLGFSGNIQMLMRKIMEENK